MERNTLLAIILSAAVLFGYQAIFAPQKQPAPVNNSQLVQTQSVNVINSPSSPTLSESTTETTSSVNKTTDYTIENTTSRFLYTNVGGALHSVDFIKNNPFPLTDVLSINGLENVQYSGKESVKKAVSLAYSDKNWQITKTFSLRSNNLIAVRMEIKNISESSILNNFTFTAFEIDQSRMDIVQNNRENGLFEYSVYANNKVFRKDNAFKFNEKNYKAESTNINWVGFRDHYHAFIVKPEFETKGYVIKADSDKQLNLSIIPQDKNLAPGESAEYDFTIYAGPQNPWIMKNYKMDFEKIIVFSKYAIYEWPAEGIYYTMAFLHKIFRHWGIAIILVGIIFYSLTYPLTMQSMVSMRKMQEAAPKIKAIQERYKNDVQKQQAETMELYRREKINPMSGCLPFLIQMPFFYALYQVMYRAQYFQGQGFLWIKDLTQPDHLIIFPFYLPILGNELNILPILSGCFMFLQQKVATKNIVVTDEQQIMQQKMMMYMMPVLMSFMFYRFTSAWGIYFLTYYSLSTFTQWKISKAAGK